MTLIFSLVRLNIIITREWFDRSIVYKVYLIFTFKNITEKLLTFMYY